MTWQIGIVTCGSIKVVVLFAFLAMKSACMEIMKSKLTQVF